MSAAHMFTTIGLVYGAVCCGFVLTILLPKRY